MKWVKVSKSRWKSDLGHTILKYRMTPDTISYLVYQPNEPLEYGDYASFNKLTSAKNSVNEVSI